MNGVRERQGLPPLYQNNLELSSVRNFFGRECATTVLVMDSQDTLADFVEGMTRHTHAVSLVFLASAPPAPLCACASVLAQMLPTDVYVNWAPREPAMSVKKLAAEVSTDAHSVDTMLDRLAARLTSSCQGEGLAAKWSVSEKCPPRVAIPVPMGVNHAKLGVVAEQLAAAVAQCGKSGLGAELDSAVLAAIQGSGWLDTSHEQALWALAGLADNNKVTHCYFSNVCMRLREMFALLPGPPTAYQVPAELVLRDGTRVSGSADFVGAEFVLEIKHIVDTTLVSAVAQTATYMAALRKKYGFVFNVRTRHLIALAEPAC
jgi:hypothetical protein